MFKKKMFAAIACVVAGLLLSFGFSAVAQNRPTSPSTSPTVGAASSIDRQFIVTAGEAGLANIAMGQLALRRSNNTQVRQFAQAEIAEQQQVKQNLSRVAPRLNVALPTAPGPKYQSLLQRLSQLSGEQFDRAYLYEGGINAHLENAATFQREAQFGQEPSVVAIANGGLPTIQQHFTTASSLTSYRFAQVPVRFNSSTPGVPQSNNAPDAPASTTPR